MTSSPTHGSGDAKHRPGHGGGGGGGGGASAHHPRPQQSVRIVTDDFPQYFAIISRCRREIRMVGNPGCILQSAQLPRARITIPPK